MKKVLFYTFLFFGFVIHSQVDNTQSLVDALSEKVAQSEKGEKLKWLDSLSSVTHRKPEFKFDSIVNEAIVLAKELDSVNTLVKMKVYRINHFNNYLGQAENGKKAYLDVKSQLDRVTDKKILTQLYIEAGDSFYFLNDYPTSIELYDKAIQLSQEGDFTRYHGIALMYKGSSQSFAGDFSKASQSLQEASRIFEESKDTFNIIGAKNSLSIIYSQNGFFPEAKKERDEAIVWAKAISSYDHLTSFYYNAATDAGKMDNWEEQLRNLNLAMQAVSDAGKPSFYEPMFFSGMVSAYAKQNNVDKAQEYLDKIEANPDYQTGRYRSFYLRALKNLAFAKGNYTEAIKHGEELLELTKEGTQYESRQNAEKFLAKAYEAAGNKAKAYHHFTEFYAIKDSITNVQKINGLSYYQTLYETEKRDRTIESQKSNIAVLDAKNKLKGQWLIIGGLSLVFLFGSIFLIRSRKFARKKQQMQEGFTQNLIEAQEKERIRVARELHDSVGQKLMLLTRKTKEKNDPAMSDLANGTLDELRSIARGLHPAALEKLGLTAAIEAMINEVDMNSDVFFTHQIDQIDDAFDKDQSLHLYRIIQEVLNNMIKHSEAKAASIQIDRNVLNIETMIKDNGKGFDISEKRMGATSLGMKTLAERAKILRSKLEINSKPNQGTQIQIIIPTA